jgi:F-type H+-transporting ATPase subunit h
MYTTQAANSHVGQVKEFHSPAAPSAPQVPSSADLAKELDAYEKAVRGIPLFVLVLLLRMEVLTCRLRPQDVPTSSTSAKSSSAEDADAAPGETADEYLAFVEREAKHVPSAAHH